MVACSNISSKIHRNWLFKSFLAYTQSLQLLECPYYSNQKVQDQNPSLHHNLKDLISSLTFLSITVCLPRFEASIPRMLSELQYAFLILAQINFISSTIIVLVKLCCPRFIWTMYYLSKVNTKISLLFNKQHNKRFACNAQNFDIIFMEKKSNPF